MSRHYFEKYEQLFEARYLKRKVTLIIGPTNSGKTYQAIQSLVSAPNGVYLGPLRLLALEKYEEISQVKPCNLITGEEQIITEFAKFSAQTIETFSTEKFFDTVVIDEVQLIGDISRGIAYSRAVVGSYCRNLILVGSPNCREVILKIFNRLGEEVEIIEKERLSPLEVGKVRKDIQSIQKGSAIIVFSRKDVFEFKEHLERLGMSVSTIYGSLSPEVRKKEAKKFSSGESDYLIATDAIGMGLNLPIKEIIFSKTEKFDGNYVRHLNPSEIKQIAGRAGRFGIKDSGIVSALSFNSLELIKKSIVDVNNFCDGPFIFPSLSQSRKMMEDLKTDKLSRMIRFFSNNFNDDLFKTNKYEEILQLSSIIDRYNDIPLNEKYDLLWTPVNIKDLDCLILFQEFVENIDNNERLSINFIPKRNLNALSLMELENLQKKIIMFKSLSKKFKTSQENVSLINKLYDDSNDLIFYKLNLKRNKLK